MPKTLISQGKAGEVRIVFNKLDKARLIRLAKDDREQYLATWIRKRLLDLADDRAAKAAANYQPHAS